MGRPDVGFIFFEEHNDSHAPANLSVFPAKQFDAHAVGRMHEGNARRRVDIRRLQAELNPFTAQVRTEAVEIARYFQAKMIHTPFEAGFLRRLLAGALAAHDYHRLAE